MRSWKLWIAAWTIAVLAWGNTAMADLAEQGRAILESNKGAVVTLKLVIKQQFSMPGGGSNDNESREEVTAAIIDPSGLTVTALSATDPTAMFESMMAATGRQMQFKSDIASLQILMEDGSEVEGQVVLRDKDLDLVFIRPTEKPAEPLPYVDLAADATPQLLDQVITINRLGRVAGRTYSASVERIDAIMERPRTLYIPGNDPTQTGVGCPAFLPDGRAFGLLVTRTMKTGGGTSMSSMFRGGFGDTMMGVILPAADILEVAAQAPEEAAEEPEEEAPAEEAPAEEADAEAAATE